jgi:hypothetical protein
MQRRRQRKMQRRQMSDVLLGLMDERSMCTHYIFAWWLQHNANELRHPNRPFLGIPSYSFGDYERHNGYYCPLPPLMQRDDSANLGDIDDNNDDNTADGGGMGDTTFLATMLEEQHSRGAPYLRTVIYLFRPPSSLYAELIIEHSLAASSQSSSAMTFHKTSGMTTIGAFVLLLPETGQTLQAGLELVPISRACNHVLVEGNPDIRYTRHLKIRKDRLSWSINLLHIIRR